MKKEDIIRYVSENANGTVLSFPERGPWGNSNYRGNFSGWIPASLIYRYGANSVSEIFAGGGTTSDLCKDLNISYCGIDLNPEPVRENIVSMDILNMNEELPDLFYNADLQILHPPYPSINGVHYSNEMWKDTKNVGVSDIQEMNWENGMAAINKALMRGYMAMPKGSYQACVVGDIRRKCNGKSIFRSMLKDLCIYGEIEQILVKMQHNTVSSRNTSFNTCKRNFFFIEHEFIVVIKKPSGYEIAVIVPHSHKCDIRDSKNTATWKDLVMTVLRNFEREVSLEEIYSELAQHQKAKNNENYQSKIRQTLQRLRDSGLTLNTNRGKWKLA